VVFTTPVLGLVFRAPLRSVSTRVACTGQPRRAELLAAAARGKLRLHPGLARLIAVAFVFEMA